MFSSHFLALVSRAELISFSAGSAILLMSLAPNKKRLFVHVESHFDRSDVPINFFIAKDSNNNYSTVFLVTPAYLQMAYTGS